MTKIELIELLKNDMLDAVRYRDKIDAYLYTEEYGYFNGQYRAFESVLRLLNTINIQELDYNSSDERIIYH